MATTSLYPLTDKEELRKHYVGKSLNDIPAPAAIFDLSKLKNNCTRMLEACEQLDFGWRAHIKTHKSYHVSATIYVPADLFRQTTELTRLQVGPTGPVNIIVSTLIEAENILPLLLEYKEHGRAVNLLYSFPISPTSNSTIQRLSVLAKGLGPHGLSLMIDHPAQIPAIQAIRTHSGNAPDLFLKIDMGGHRAGVEPGSAVCNSLISSLLSLHSAGEIHLLGLYSHAGQSYSSTSRASALDFLRQEFEALLLVSISITSHPDSGVLSPEMPLVLSVGATPTTTSVRNLLIPDLETPAEEAKEIAALRATLKTIRDLGCKVEIHAGVYPTLDVQQLATHSLPTSGPHAMLTWSDLAFTVLAEVSSFYPNRGPGGSPEVLVGAGCIALGREPCKAYSGWGIVSPWGLPGAQTPTVGPEEYQGWIVTKASQEHGTLGWMGKWEGSGGGKTDALSDGSKEGIKIGARIRIWPNHACITGVGFGWYFVVDSTREGKEDEIIDVWPRWRGW
ncbi:D-serine deHydratase [Hyphodiscus hymeniophilus]|uniref:D-serine deHydratase n=1 Tax=Hyphodiscus hymeniophilus TaxID=353542 RepID=A0A9P6VPJ3_9HELO|nr:D-serine deHydratase [Hyphodiscus hymeniophilus]